MDAAGDGIGVERLRQDTPSVDYRIVDRLDQAEAHRRRQPGVEDVDDVPLDIAGSDLGADLRQVGPGHVEDLDPGFAGEGIIDCVPLGRRHCAARIAYYQASGTSRPTRDDDSRGGQHRADEQRAARQHSGFRFFGHRAVLDRCLAQLRRKLHGRVVE